MQKKLKEKQIESFYKYWGDETQCNHFLYLLPKSTLGTDNVIVDIGGGVGFFADSVRKLIDAEIRVLDADPIAIKTCLDKGINAYLDNALKPTYHGDEDVVCFNLILHHLIGDDECSTLNLQIQAIKVWSDHCKFIFVNEYSYDSYIKNLSGRLIYLITSNKLLSIIASFISRFVPSLRANTFGVGVRFRGGDEWVKLFEQSGFRVISKVKGEQKDIPFPRRLLFVKNFSQDSWLLEPLVKSTIGIVN